MAALLVGLSVMSVMMSAALPVWSQATRREREEELIWRGEQYRRAIMLFQRRFANTFPPTLDVLVEQRFLRKKYKDPITNEDFQIIPVGGAMAPGQIGLPGQQTGNQAPGFGTGQQGAPPGGGGFGGLGGGQTSGSAPGGTFGGGTAGTQPAMGIQGVTSKSKDTSIKIYNGMNKYNQWAFVYLAASTQGGAGGGAFGTPGQTGPGGFGQPMNPGGGGFGQPMNPGGGGFGQPMNPGGGGFGQPANPGGGFGQPMSPGGGFGQPMNGQPTVPPVPGGFGQPQGGFGQPGGMAPGGAPAGGATFTPIPPRR